jgi:hypothetical protein
VLGFGEAHLNPETISKLIQYVEDKDDDELTFQEFVSLMKRVGL